jgi:hypothetical protein
MDSKNNQYQFWYDSCLIVMYFLCYQLDSSYVNANDKTRLIKFWANCFCKKNQLFHEPQDMFYSRKIQVVIWIIIKILKSKISQRVAWWFCCLITLQKIVTDNCETTLLPGLLHIANNNTLMKSTSPLTNFDEVHTPTHKHCNPIIDG